MRGREGYGGLSSHLPSPREPTGLAFGEPEDRLREWRGGVGDGGRRLLSACGFPLPTLPRKRERE
jgi:hypothetical protein